MPLTRDPSPGQAPRNKQEVALLYQANKISFVEAAYYLVRLGLSPDDACTFVSRLISQKYNQKE